MEHAMDDIVEEMPVVNALAAFIKYLDVRSRFPRLPPSPHHRPRAPRVPGNSATTDVQPRAN